MNSSFAKLTLIKSQISIQNRFFLGGGGCLAINKCFLGNKFNFRLTNVYK